MVARLKLRPGQKIVNAGLKLKVLRGGRANGGAHGDRAAARLIIEMSRDVTLNAEMPAEVSNHRYFKSIPSVILPDTRIRAKGDAPAVGFPQGDVTDEKFELRVIVLNRLLGQCGQGRAHQNKSTDQQAQGFLWLRHLDFLLGKDGFEFRGV